MTTFAVYRFQLAGLHCHRFFQVKPWKGLDNAHRKVPVRPAHAFPTQARFRSMCPKISRQLSSAQVLLLRSISLLGFRATDLSIQLARHRNVSAFSPAQTVSRWHPRNHCPQYLSQGQPNQKLAYLCRVRCCPHCPRPQTLCGANPWPSISTKRFTPSIRQPSISV